MPREQSFRTVAGLARWAQANGLTATDHTKGGVPWKEWHVETPHGLLVVKFDKVVDSITDAHLHRESGTHSLGSNNLVTLLRVALTGKART